MATGSTEGPPAGPGAEAGARRSDAPAACPSPAQSSPGIRQRAPPFTKHEKLRLGHVFCEGDTASGVIASRGPMTRPQKDARTSRNAVWVVLVAEMFNSDKVFDVPDECADGGIDPNLHPHKRTGEFLKSKWTEVRALSVWFCFVCSSGTCVWIVCVRACIPWVRLLTIFFALVLLFDCVARLFFLEHVQGLQKVWAERPLQEGGLF